VEQCLFMRYAELVGWASSAILLATITRQVYTQWKTRSTAGVSHWLFVGQLTASAGFTIYSLLLHNWVYVVSNVALLTTAAVGQMIYRRNKRHPAKTR
jgi:MtN3 and saliva related transmembrane protein